MANTVKVKRSAVAGKVPVVTDLQLGELAINTNDGKLFLKKSVGGVESIVDVTAAGGATVTSVGLSMPSIFTVSGSPVTTSGTLTAALNSQTANQFFAAPYGSNGVPSFRALAIADLAGISKTSVTVYESGSGTYTVPAGCRYLMIEALGGGGGGGGSGGSNGAGQGSNGGQGGNTTINSTLIVAYGGAGGAGGEGSIGMGGGIGGVAAGTANVLANGQRGTANGRYNTADGSYVLGGVGGACAFGKSGGDGGGANATAVVRAGGGGGGAYCMSLVASPAASYTYAVGAAGTGGAAGSNGVAGEAGRSGMVIFTAFFA